MGFAVIMIEEHAWRTVHLADDYALGAVDGEGSVFRHQRNVTHVNILFFNVFDFARAGIDIDNPDNQT